MHTHTLKLSGGFGRQLVVNKLPSRHYGITSQTLRRVSVSMQINVERGGPNEHLVWNAEVIQSKAIEYVPVQVRPVFVEHIEHTHESNHQ